jgi:hypothetical protein
LVPSWKQVLAVAERQHGVLTHRQLIALGVAAQGIKHRAARGRLHRIHQGVYAVGRPHLDRDGRWMAALLACGPGAVLSHSSAAELWRLDREGPGIEVTIISPRSASRPGIQAHRTRSLLDAEVRPVRVTDPLRTLADLAPRWREDAVEDAIERADRNDLCTPDQLSARLGLRPPAPGSGIVRRVLERWTLTLTQTQLERRMLAIVRRAGLARPLTQQSSGLLLARARTGDRSGQPSLSPYGRPPDGGRQAGPGAHGGGSDAAALLPRPDHL